jgi:uncharacterized repeat protein (TIGR03803 family)
MRLGAASASFASLVVFVLGVVTIQPARAQTFTTLYEFTGPSTDGAYPEAGLVRDETGNLYGTAWGGGSGACDDEFGDVGCGTVFKVDTSGKETTLYSFTGQSDGGYPFAELVLDAAGNLYGTTSHFGSSGGCGTVFKLDTSGKATVLHSFTGGTTDGCYPYGGLLRDQAGNLYGTTLEGGGTGCYGEGCGVVFKLDTTGTETVLHSFAGYPSDGALPDFTSLLMDQKGNVYGVTSEGGSSSVCSLGCGVVFKLSKAGTETVLHSFTGGAEGCFVFGTPAMDKSGNIYGTTDACGSSGYGYGVVWKVSKKGTETVLHAFAGSDGTYPIAGVILDAKGNLYGDTEGGGSNDNGTVYKLSKSGKLVVLRSLNEGTDGANPYGGVIRDKKGNLYGTTSDGGDLKCNPDFGCGTVWKLTAQSGVGRGQ